MSNLRAKEADLWIRDVDKALLKGVCDLELTGYSELSDMTILNGKLKDEGVLGGVDKIFVLARKRMWVPKVIRENKNIPRSEWRKHAHFFARIKYSEAYPDGLILTPFRREDVRYHLETTMIDEKTKVGREELMGCDQDDLIERVFATYYSSLVNKFCERDKHLVFYSINNE